jgi:transcriptional regulator with PAS, ATPase and Fis domain
MLSALLPSSRQSLDRKYGFENIIGRSEALVSVLEMAGRAARSNFTILVRAETGTGKELLARAIHIKSLRKDKPFVTINCGAIPRELLESALFGHVKGSFTGAMANEKDRIELADGGTLFLTKSARCQWNFRSSSCGWCSRGRSRRSEQRNRPAWTCGLPPRHIGI